MSRMSPEERAKRRDRVAAEALESVAKSEQFNFRMDTDTIKRLYKVAAEQRKPVGAIVREWVLERLNQEQRAPSTADVIQEIHALREQTMSCFDGLSQRIMALGDTSLLAAPQPSSLSFLTEHESNKGLWTDTSESCPQTAESVPMPCVASYSVEPNIPKAEIFTVLSQLHTTRPGYVEVPDWLVEHFKLQLQT